MYEILGVQEVNYTSKKTGKEVNGFNLAVAMEKQGYVGVAVDTIYISRQLADRVGFYPSIGQKIEIRYEKYGNNYYPSDVIVQ